MPYDEIPEMATLAIAAFIFLAIFFLFTTFLFNHFNERFGSPHVACGKVTRKRFIQRLVVPNGSTVRVFPARWTVYVEVNGRSLQYLASPEEFEFLKEGDEIVATYTKPGIWGPDHVNHISKTQIQTK